MNHLGTEQYGSIPIKFYEHNKTIHIDDVSLGLALRYKNASRSVKELYKLHKDLYRPHVIEEVKANGLKNNLQLFFDPDGVRLFVDRSRSVWVSSFLNWYKDMIKELEVRL